MADDNSKYPIEIFVYKNKKTNHEVTIRHANGGVTDLIKPLYECSDEWLRIYPIDSHNAKDIAQDMLDRRISANPGDWTDDFKFGYRKGIEDYLKSLKK